MKANGLKVLKSALFVIASGIMGICLWFTPEVSGTVSVSFTTVLGLYLGLDIAAMIAKTSSLEKGSFEKLNVYKYIISMVCLIVLLILCLIVKKRADVNTAMTSFIVSTMIVIGCVIGGLEGNKIATGTSETKEE